MDNQVRKVRYITRQSMLTGKFHTMEIPMTDNQFAEIKLYLAGHDAKTNRCIQTILPFNTADEREFLMTGSTPEEWERIFGEEHE